MIATGVAVRGRGRRRATFAVTALISLTLLASAILVSSVVTLVLHEQRSPSLPLASLIVLDVILVAAMACASIAFAVAYLRTVGVAAHDDPAHEEPDEHADARRESAAERLNRAFKHFDKRELLEAKEAFDSIHEGDLASGDRGLFRWGRVSTRRILQTVHQVPRSVRIRSKSTGDACVDFANLLSAVLEQPGGAAIVSAVLDDVIAPTAQESLIHGFALEELGLEARAILAYRMAVMGSRGKDVARTAGQCLKRLIEPYTEDRPFRPCLGDCWEDGGYDPERLDAKIEAALAKCGMRPRP